MARDGVGRGSRCAASSRLTSRPQSTSGPHNGAIRDALVTRPMDQSRIDNLIEILRDKSARIDERDDAAIDLGFSDDPRVIDALLEVGSQIGDEEMVVASCGESVAQIAIRTGRFERSWREILAPAAARELIDGVRAERPELLSG